jgi:hypothetical protein
MTHTKCMSHLVQKNRPAYYPGLVFKLLSCFTVIFSEG